MIFYKDFFSGRDPGAEYILSGPTYAEVYAYAEFIRRLGNTDECICLCTDSKVLIMASLIASICGGPGVILPHSKSQEALKEVKEESGFNIAVTDMPFESRDFKVIVPDREKNYNPVPMRDPDSVFLKVFTGGSTGKSKLWQKSPRNVFGEALYHTRSLKISKDDIIFSTVPPQHIYGLLFTVLAPFISSAKVTEKIYTYPREILLSIDISKATILVSIPIHYRILKGNSFTLSSLRLALSSGGSLDFNDAGYFYNQTGVAVAEVFGSTETGGIAMRYNSGKDIPWKPFDNIEWKITGENLCVRSEFISADLPKGDDGYYTTEDRVIDNGDNTFTHLGRSDGIVKVAGKRVDLKEIEDKLKMMPGVSDAVVISMHKENGRRDEITAVIEGTVDTPGVRRFMKERLESYALPKKIRIVDKMPVLSTGKYDRQKIEEIIKDV